jgi:hypothetical protein
VTNPSKQLHFCYTHWRKSSESENAGECVEVAAFNSVVGVRDSKNPYGGVLTLSTTQWQSLIRGVKHGEFDL